MISALSGTSDTTRNIIYCMVLESVGKHKIFSCQVRVLRGNAVVQLVVALHCKSEGRRFDSKWCHWNFSLT